LTVATVCIVIACLLPIVCTGIAKAGMFGKPRAKGGFDNHDPRAWLARQTGYRARANAAQANSFEALPLFIAGVLVAQQMHAPQRLVDLLAVVFVVLRIVYIAMYLADRQLARSAVWTAGLGVSIALVFASSF
jgi:uncharacterized MAPEG superfamily protein